MVRPNKGAAHVDALPGTQQSKRRAKCILQTMAGEMSVKEACDEIGICPSQFDNLRRQFLLGGLDGLQPRPMGRPARVSGLSVAETEALQQRVAELEREVRLLQAQLAVAGLPRAKGPRRSKSRGASRSRPAPPRPPAAG